MEPQRTISRQEATVSVWLLQYLVKFRFLESGQNDSLIHGKTIIKAMKTK